jgi:hypothetical protein
MDDKFLHELRREPRPEFARALRARLDQQSEPAPARFRFLRPAFGAAAALAAVALLFAFPAVRASAQAFLDMFRVRNFTAVPFDESRMERLKSLKQDNAMLVFDKQDVVHDPGAPQVVTDAAAAGSLAGMIVRVPGVLPRGLAADTVAVEGAGEVRLTVHADRLRSVLDALGLSDVQVPPALDGQTLTVRTSPAVVQRFRNDWREAHLIQAKSPEVSLPTGVDLAQLGEIGLRILGLDPAEARRMASTIDWTSTLVVPVPANASSFREVTVHGQRGLLVTTSAEPTATSNRRRAGAVVMWTEGDRVFALAGNLDSMDLMQMAESVR